MLFCHQSYVGGCGIMQLFKIISDKNMYTVQSSEHSIINYPRTLTLEFTSLKLIQ